MGSRIKNEWVKKWLCCGKSFIFVWGKISKEPKLGRLKNEMGLCYQLVNCYSILYISVQIREYICRFCGSDPICFSNVSLVREFLFYSRCSYYYFMHYLPVSHTLFMASAIFYIRRNNELASQTVWQCTVQVVLDIYHPHICLFRDVCQVFIYFSFSIYKFIDLETYFIIWNTYKIGIYWGIRKTRVIYIEDNLYLITNYIATFTFYLPNYTF